MDSARGYEQDRGSGDEPRLDIGTDERRMHVRAYNHWVSLLRGRAYPAIGDLDPANIADFGAHSVLLDFSRGVEDPRIAFLGRALREECGLPLGIDRIADVPARSLLSRLTDHYLQIIANRAPIGFEAEFVGTRGHNTLYRGILMPFSSDDEGIDYIYGVINWKEMVDAETQAQLDREVARAVRETPRPAPVPAPTVWADGPIASAPAEPAVEGGLADILASAREGALAMTAVDVRGRATLYRALGRAHDFAEAAASDPDAYADLLDDAGIKVQARAPMTAVAKLVFGVDYDKTRLTEFAAVLAFARRAGVPAGGLATVLETTDGGIKAVVKAERARRSSAAAPRRDPVAVLAERPALGNVALDLTAEGLVVLIARATGDGTFDIIGNIDGGAAQAALRAAAR